MNTKKFIFYFWAIITFVVVSVCSAETLNGKCVKVLDGDTIKISVSDELYKIRFAAIDTPEKKQEFGLISKQALQDLIGGQDISVEIINTDLYGRKVGFVTCNGLDVNGYMIREGYAWHYIQYDKYRSKLYTEYERQARIEHKGLWSTENPIEPWKWRKGEKLGS